MLYALKQARQPRWWLALVTGRRAAPMFERSGLHAALYGPPTTRSAETKGNADPTEGEI